MQYPVVYAISIVFLLLSGCQTTDAEAWVIIPRPNEVVSLPGTFSFAFGIDLDAATTELDPVVKSFMPRLEELGIEVVSTAPKRVVLSIDASGEMPPESYEIEVDNHEVQLLAADDNGAFYGLMTIWQQLKLTGAKSIPLGTIKDEPRFSYRGVMLDESRHFFGKEKVKQLIDLMAVFKLNRFHWHLTDTPGWRMEIKAFPRLTTVGARGNHTNPTAPAAYYTQEDIREVVAYAAERMIAIVPEIDMPGHAAAANRAYPEFSGGGSKKYPDFTFDPGREATYAYLGAILEEVSDLFPHQYIHLGGDEVHFGNEQWKNNDSIQWLMRENEMDSLVEVEQYFMERMASRLTAMNKRLAGWDEIITSELDTQNTLVYWWRHDQPQLLTQSLAKGFPTVLCPRIPLYFDFVQAEVHQNGRRWDGFGSLKDVYAYPESTHDFTEREAPLIRGLQGNLWTERFDREQWIDFMLFPRMLALAESAWTETTHKDMDDFTGRLDWVLDYLDGRQVYYFNPLAPEAHPEPLK